MKFGLWFEPEMISEDSDLFRAHPDWALQIPGRERTESRWQMVLDYTRPEVVDAIYEQLAAILSTANIEYVKWDANRHLTEAASQALPPERRGETLHRYMLGLYDLQERLMRNFPNLLIEGCSGGGGRFDAGMLYYFPQIWCSDNTDPIDRLKIQYGTSFAYPSSAMGAHVAASYTKTRCSDFQTRANVAMAGTFGYELDLNHLSPEDLALIPGQCARFHAVHHLVDNGDLHRLTSPFEDEVTVWINVAKDKSQFLLTAVQPYVIFNSRRYRIRLRGLEASALYRCEDGTAYTGEFLMKFGWTAPVASFHTQSWQLLFTKE